MGQALSRVDVAANRACCLMIWMSLAQDGLTIENPEGFSSEYLLKASKLMIDLDMQKLITSWGKTLEVEKAGRVAMKMNVLLILAIC